LQIYRTGLHLPGKGDLCRLFPPDLFLFNLCYICRVRKLRKNLVLSVTSLIIPARDIWYAGAYFYFFSNLMEYNTKRDKLIMPEYGRNIQQMVDYMRTIEDPVKRQKNAKAIIELMGVLNPHLKNVEDFRHKLWDHLFLIADFQLEVDSPYPTPTKEKLFRKPAPLPYPKVHRKYRHLGKNLNAVIDKALAETDEEKRRGFTHSIAYYMKLAYTNWHREPVHDDMIKEELSEMTHGALNYTSGGIKVRFDPRQLVASHKKNNGGGGGRSGGGHKSQGNRNNNSNGGNNGNGHNNKNRNNKNNRKK
jgi:hypothetical protein